MNLQGIQFCEDEACRDVDCTDHGVTNEDYLDDWEESYPFLERVRDAIMSRFRRITNAIERWFYIRNHVCTRVWSQENVLIEYVGFNSATLCLYPRIRRTIMEIAIGRQAQDDAII